MSERADRLAAAVLILGLVREPAAHALDALAAVPLLKREEWNAWREVDDADVALIHACVSAEFERRERQWSALEFLLHVRTAPAVEPGRGGSAGSDGGGAVVLVSRREAVAVAASAVGWEFAAPEHDG